MRGAASPEELETMLEDAFVLRDGAAVADLFEATGLLVAGGRTVRIEDLEPDWRRLAGFVAEPRRVVQSGDTALVVAARSITVARRGPDRLWRYTIALLEGREAG